MRLWAFFSFQLVVLCMSYAHDEPTYYLQGSFGKRTVGVQIDHFEDVTYLKYFFLKNKHDVILKGYNDSTSFYFQREDPKTSKVDQSIIINKESNNSWKGFWVYDGDSLPISLSPIVTASVKHQLTTHDASHQLDPYGYFRTSTLKLKRTKTTYIKENKIVWYKEPISGVVSFQVYPKKGKNKSKSLNRWLLNQQLNMVEKYFNCGTYGFRGNYEQHVEIQFIDHEFISYGINSKTACYSFNQSDKTEYFTLDVFTAERYSLEDFMFIGNTAIPKEKTTSWFNYRREVFSPFINNLIVSLYPDNVVTKDCNYKNEAAWRQPVWYLTEKGLYLGAVFPGLNKSCNEPSWAIVPFSILSSHGNIKTIF